MHIINPLFVEQVKDVPIKENFIENLYTTILQNDEHNLQPLYSSTKNVVQCYDTTKKFDEIKKFYSEIKHQEPFKFITEKQIDTSFFNYDTNTGSFVFDRDCDYIVEYELECSHNIKSVKMDIGTKLVDICENISSKKFKRNGFHQYCLPIIHLNYHAVRIVYEIENVLKDECPTMKLKTTCLIGDSLNRQYTNYDLKDIEINGETYNYHITYGMGVWGSFVNRSPFEN